MEGRSLCNNFLFHPRSTVFLLLCYACILQLHHCCFFSEAAAVTDPKEVNALRIIARKMGQTKWNFSVDPCGRDPSWYSASIEEEFGVICNCSFNRNTTCHVLQINIPKEEMAGIIPPELANLTYLERIDLRNNLLHGSIPASIGSLTRLKYLSFGINNLSGEIPKEFGKLTNLLTLSFDSNDLSGTLPPELGNLTNMVELYILSNRFTGEVPTTFANLKKMKVLCASSNNFTGKLPDFIGNWNQLNTLKFEGTSLEGPIPSSISNLTKLITLIICDVPRGGTLLSFQLQNLKNLTTLFLRNNMISGNIPDYIGELDKLERLDLSFNNLIGQIPNSLMKLSSLKYLFLGSNYLTGQLPSWLSASGNKVDLSYNNFSGEVPTWVSDQNLNVNLVGNFLQGNHRSLICLQSHFPCHKGNPQRLLHGIMALSLAQSGRFFPFVDKLLGKKLGDDFQFYFESFCVDSKEIDCIFEFFSQKHPISKKICLI